MGHRANLIKIIINNNNNNKKKVWCFHRVGYYTFVKLIALINIYTVAPLSCSYISLIWFTHSQHGPKGKDSPYGKWSDGR